MCLRLCLCLNPRLKVSIHVYQLNEEGASEEGTDEDDEVVACQQWVLPSREFHGLWPTLIYDHAIKVSDVLE